MTMRKFTFVLLLALASCQAPLRSAEAATFGGYECTIDCSGHRAGYEWAEAKGIVSETECETIVLRAPNRTSFYEGCLAYVEDPARDADEDDDGDEIEHKQAVHGPWENYR
jgi:hypothetical protein